MINTELNCNLYKDIILLYCPPKVGSTSIVTSIRLFASEKFIVFHTHENKIVDLLQNENYNQICVTDIIKNNTVYNNEEKRFRKIYIIDIYRSPIERKISEYFQKLSDLHFNNTELNIVNYNIEKIINRFNNIFPHISEIDYFKERFNINYDGDFDFVNKYLLYEKDNVYYIKLRLDDSDKWGEILSKLLNTDIKIVNDYNTSNKIIGKLYNDFKNKYKLPANFLKIIESCKYLNYYYNSEEKEKYINLWKNKLTDNYNPFTNHEYKLYLYISNENKYLNAIRNHYSDDGCLCNKCIIKRKNIVTKINLGFSCHNDSNRHDHSSNNLYNNKIFLKLYPNETDEPIETIINLINFN
jgi:hypothetical protein